MSACGVGHGHAGTHAADHAQIPLPSGSLGKAPVERLPRLEVVGHGGVRRHHQAKADRHHADDDRRTAVDVDPLADDGRVAAIAALPHGGAQQDRGRRRERVVVGLEGAAQRRFGAEHGEVVGGHEPDAQLFGIVLAGQGRGRRPDRAEAVELRRAVVEVLQLRPGERRPRVALRRLVGPHEHQPLGIAEGQRLDEQRVGDAEDGGVGGHAQRQRGQRGGGEARRLAQPAPGIRDVAQRLVDQPSHTDLPDTFLHRLDAAHLRQHGAARVGAAAATGDAPFRQDLDVARQLGVEVVGGAAAASQRAPHAANPGQHVASCR